MCTGALFHGYFKFAGGTPVVTGGRGPGKRKFGGGAWEHLPSRHGDWNIIYIYSVVTTIINHPFGNCLYHQ